jgi:hypothetical protein
VSARHCGYGHNHEVWLLEDGAWRIARIAAPDHSRSNREVKKEQQ